MFDAAARRIRQFRLIAQALSNRERPILAQIVPTRRCNLACAYCNEYDKVSPPVPLAEMLKRIDRLGELGTGIVTISGGEPLLHPDLDDIIARIRQHGMIAGLISNGFHLSPERIERLNQAGLEYLQISLDGVEPDATSFKTLKSLEGKLHQLACHARFQVNINPVFGASIRKTNDVVEIARTAKELGFTLTIGILHDEAGQLKRLTSEETQAYELAIDFGRSAAERLARSVTRACQERGWATAGLVFGSMIRILTGQYAAINEFQNNLVNGRPNDWHCLAGARYLYVCEHGLVHYCSQQRGTPGIPLAQYGVSHIRTESRRPKPCAPLCTIGCVHRASSLDNLLRAAKLRRF